MHYQQPFTVHGVNLSSPHNKTAESSLLHHIHPSSSLGAFQMSQLLNQREKMREDQQIRVTINFGVPSTATLHSRPPQVSHHKDKMATSKTLLKPNKQITHNLSAINLRNPETIPNYPKRKTSKEVIGQGKGKKPPQRQRLARFFQNKRTTNENCKDVIKKTKEPPSFIRRKQAKNVFEERGIKLLKKLGEHCYLVMQSNSNFLLAMEIINKKDILEDNQALKTLKAYLKNSQINHNLLVKYFGFLSDQEHIYLFQEYLQGETLAHCIENPREDFNESTIGPIICSILTAIDFFRKTKKSYGIIDPQYLLYSMNICKFKREIMMDQSLESKPKDILFDIWCIGKLTFELVTHEELVPKFIMENINTIQQIFQSKEITKCIEIGFKRFEEKSISRELVEFLITTLWTIQTQNYSFDMLWQLDFVKLYHEEDVWKNSSKEAD